MNVKSLVQVAEKVRKDHRIALLKRAKSVLMKRDVTLMEISDILGVSPREATHIIDEIALQGHSVKVMDGEVGITKQFPQPVRKSVDAKAFFDGKRYRFGAVACTHLASRYARLDVLRALYDIYEQEGISTVYHAGNLVDGECRFNKHDLLTRAGFEAQVEYVCEEYPEKKGIVTKFITGDDHEGWWMQREGINFGERLMQTAFAGGRKDLQYIGHAEVDISIKAPQGQAWMRVVHPGGGSAYAISYTAQKLVESYQGGEKPHILLMGHYHKFDWGYPREVHTVQVGCVEDQTLFMRKKKIQAMVGGCIIEFHQSPTGEVNRFSGEWIPFYDKGFYEKGDRYKVW